MSVSDWLILTWWHEWLDKEGIIFPSFLATEFTDEELSSFVNFILEKDEKRRANPNDYK